MTRRTLVATIISSMLVLSACAAGRSQTSATSTSSVSITTTGAALVTTARRQEPALGAKSRATDAAAFATYWKKLGYTVTTDQQALRPDGTIKTFRFAASRRRRGADKAGTIAVTISDVPPPDARSQTVRNAPPLNDTATAKNIAAYVAYYEKQGYKVTLNQQTYRPDGTVQEFHFVAKQGQGASRSRVSADIDGTTGNVSISENLGKASKR